MSVVLLEALTVAHVDSLGCPLLGHLPKDVRASNEAIRTGEAHFAKGLGALGKGARQF